MGRPTPCHRTWLTAALLALLCWPPGCSQNTQRDTRTSGGPAVRVRLVAGQSQAMLTATAPPTVQATHGAGPHRVNFPAGAPVALSLGGNGTWLLGNVALGTGELTIEPAAVGSVAVNGKAYRGTYRFVPTAPGTFDVVNHVDIDSYLKSVVPREMPSRWDLEAHKAQAITARTYALYEARTSGGQHWDLFPDVRSQVYGGLESETAATSRAVDETAGVVLAARNEHGQDRIFKAYFSSTCGGVTQSAHDAFGDAWTEPLSEQNVGPVCNASKRFNWGPITVRKDELTRRFRSWGAKKDRAEKDMADVVAIRVAHVNRFGRPTRFEVTDARGNKFHWRGEEFRWAVNNDAQPGTTLFSSFCKPVDEGASISFVDGHGFGHGVGLCQFCAQARAEAGWAHEDIVLRAFPTAKLARAY